MHKSGIESKIYQVLTIRGKKDDTTHHLLRKFIFDIKFAIYLNLFNHGFPINIYMCSDTEFLR